MFVYSSNVNSDMLKLFLFSLFSIYPYLCICMVYILCFWPLFFLNVWPGQLSTKLKLVNIYLNTVIDTSVFVKVLINIACKHIMNKICGIK